MQSDCNSYYRRIIGILVALRFRLFVPYGRAVRYKLKS
jgi:hypothetical protein